HKHAGKSDHHDHDPHLWLGSESSQALLKHIAAALAKADPPHAADYKKNAEAFGKKIEELKKEYRPKFLAIAKAHDQKATDDKEGWAKQGIPVVSFHDSLRYFADDYGLEVVAVVEEVPGADPSSAQMQKLVETCKEKKPGVLAVEPQYKQDMIDAIKRELDKN